MIAPATSSSIDFRPATRAERFRAIRGISFREGTPPRVQSQLRRLVEQVEANSSDASGTQARQETLAAKLGVSVRTLQRWLSLAVAESLLEVDDSWTWRGRSRRMAIDWCRVLSGPRRIEDQLFLDFDRVVTRQDDASHHDTVSSCNREDLCPQVILPPESPAVAPPPDPIPEPPVAEPKREQEWEGVRELLRARGVREARRTADRLQARGIEPWAVETCIRFFDAHRSRFRGAGALWSRLYELEQHQVPETDPDARWDELVALWPGLSRASRPIAARPSRTAQGASGGCSPSTEPVSGAAVRQAREERARQWLRDAARVELDYGTWFDSLSEGERQRVVDQVADRLTAERWHRPCAPEARRKLRTLVLLELERRAMNQEARA